MIAPGMGLPIFAKVELPVQGQAISKASGLLFTDVLLIVGIALGILAVLVIWAKYLRKAKPRKRLSGGEKVYRGAANTIDSEEEESEEAASRRRYKYRVRRRSHRSRNPTLSETGGLPPARSEDAAGSSH
jgi:hypothetical protein